MNKADFIEKVEDALDHIRNDGELDQELEFEDFLVELEYLLDQEMGCTT